MHKANETEREVVERKIRNVAREAAASLSWLSYNHEIRDRSWRETLECFTQFRLARQRFLEGEYELAENALPEF